MPPFDALEAAPARRPSSTSTQLVIAAPVLSPAQAETQVVRVNDDHDAKRVEEAKARAVELEQSRALASTPRHKTRH